MSSFILFSICEIYCTLSKIEHFVDEKTVRSIQAFLDGLTRESRA